MELVPDLPVDPEIPEELLTPQEIWDTIQNHPRWDTSPQSQFECFQHIQARYRLGIHQKELVKQFARSFRRCRESSNPEQTFSRILRLESPEDSYMALAVNELNPISHVHMEEEKIYLKGVEGWLGDWLSLVKYNTVPLAHHFWAGTAALSAAIGRNYYFRLADVVQMNQFTVLCGEKSTGKSHAWKLSTRVLHLMNDKIHQLYKDSPGQLQYFYRVPTFAADITGPALINQMWKNYCHTSYMVGNSGQAVPLPNQAHGIVLSDEFISFAGNSTFDASARIGILVVVGFNDRYAKQTKGEATEQIIRNMCLSFFTTTAPSWMRNTMDSDAMSGGFGDRNMFIYRKPVSCRTDYDGHNVPVIDPLKFHQMADWLVDLVTAQRSTHGYYRICMEPSPEARKLHQDWYSTALAQRNKGLRSTNMQHSIERSEIHFTRLACLLAISERLGSKGEVFGFEERHLLKAIELYELEQPHYEEFKTEASEGPLQEEKRLVLSWFRDQNRWISKTTWGQLGPGKKWGAPKRLLVLSECLDLGELQQRTKNKRVEYAIAGLESWAGTL